MRIRSFDLSKIVLEAADEQFAPGFVRSEEFTEAFRKNCELIDPVLNGGDVIDLDISVDEETQKIHLDLSFPGVWEGRKPSDESE